MVKIKKQSAVEFVDRFTRLDFVTQALFNRSFTRVKDYSLPNVAEDEMHPLRAYTVPKFEADEERTIELYAPLLQGSPMSSSTESRFAIDLTPIANGLDEEFSRVRNYWFELLSGNDIALPMYFKEHVRAAFPAVLKHKDYILENVVEKTRLGKKLFLSKDRPQIHQGIDHVQTIYRRTLRDEYSITIANVD